MGRLKRGKRRNVEELVTKFAHRAVIDNVKAHQVPESTVFVCVCVCARARARAPVTESERPKALTTRCAYAQQEFCKVALRC